MFWCSLEKDLGGSASEGNGCLEDDGCDEERDCWVSVVLSGPFGEPDDERGDDDTNIAQSVTNDVEDHGVHAHIAVAVTVSTLGGLLGKGMIVAFMNTRVSAGPSLGM